MLWDLDLAGYKLTSSKKKTKGVKFLAVMGILPWTALIALFKADHPNAYSSTLFILAQKCD